jgi:hypothetical protein
MVRRPEMEGKTRKAAGTPGNVGEVLPQGAAKGNLSILEVEITSDNTFDDVLRYDQEGYRIYFACEKEHFLELKPSEVEQLSHFTRTVYSVMRNQVASEKALDPEFDEIRRKLKVGDLAASAQQKLKLTGKEASFDRFETRMFRPDNVGKAESRGWVPVKPGEVETILPKDGHVSVKANGVEELIAFKRPKDIRDELNKQKAAQKKARYLAGLSAYENEVRRTGYGLLKPKDAASKSTWKDTVE